MNKEVAEALVNSLLGRLTRMESGYQLPGGMLSDEEIAAIEDLTGARLSKGTTARADRQSTPAIRLTRLGLVPAEGDRRLCIDFGTALSKAWGTGRHPTDTVPLVLGRAAGGGETMTVPSSLFIAKDGRIFLGALAETQYRQEPDPGRSRFDNLKRMLSDAEVGQSLYSVPLAPGVDPTGSGLTKGDLLLLYLGWLTDMALRADAQVRGADPDDLTDPHRFTKRRFAIPCFEDAAADAFGRERANWARGEMRLAIRRAQVVADTLHDVWGNLDVRIAKSVIGQIVALPENDLPDVLTEVPAIREPIAAGASVIQDAIERVSKGDFIRQYCLVVDAGAGTTDFALFLAHRSREGDPIGYSLLGPSVRMSRIAGNAVDDMLRPIVLRSCGINPETGAPHSEEEFGYIKQQLASQLRDIKQQLFATADAPVQVSLPSNASGKLELQELVNDGRYKEAGNRLRAIVHEILGTVFTAEYVEPFSRRNEAIPVHLFLTGGSSNLDIVRSLAEGDYSVHGANVRMRLATNLPRWISSLDQTLAGLVSRAFPHTAVAIGGSMPDLPPEIHDLKSAIVPNNNPPPRPGRMQVTGT